MDIEILATLGPCCGILRRGMNEPNVMHNGLCRERHDGCLGPTIYLVDAAEVASPRAELDACETELRIARTSQAESNAEVERLRAELAECRRACSNAAHLLEQARIWDGSAWHWNPLHATAALRAWEILTAALAAKGA